MYIDAKQIFGNIYVAERDGRGRRVKNHPPPYQFYYEDRAGPFRAITGERLNKHRCYKRKQHLQKLEDYKKRGYRTFESDVNPVFRLLEERYPGDQGPSLNVCFLDIEVDKDPEQGFARPSSPYAIINAVTIYNKWEDLAITLVVCPENLNMDDAADLLLGNLYQDQNGNIVTERPEGDDFGCMDEADGYIVVETEIELLLLMLDIIRDADVISGWNSGFFDMPYMINRIRHVLGGESLAKLAQEDGTEANPYEPSEESLKHINKFNLFPCPPTLRMVENFGSMERTFQIHGRVHLDYLDLYRKFTYEELHSYTLDAILQKEVNQKKIAYEGSLDQLYRFDFRRFTAYSRQDVMGLSAIDDKRKMIDLANSMAHMAGVTMDKVLGSVAIIEQAILRELHRNGLICYDRMEKEKDLPVPGAFVVEPEKGEYRWICSYDFNSLYPTVIRLINISPETLVGQFDLSRTHQRWYELYSRYNDSAKTWGQFTGALEYHDIMDETDVMLKLVLEDGEEVEAPACEWKELLRENNWSLSANGTVFDLSREGIVTQCMSKWYEDRADMKQRAKKAFLAADKLEGEEKKKMLEEANYYDMVQLVKKIFLNSTYGAYLNKHFRFYDPRLGASVTLSGRVMTKYMVNKLEELLDD